MVDGVQKDGNEDMTKKILYLLMIIKLKTRFVVNMIILLEGGKVG